MEEYDLLVVADATNSMSDYLASLNHSLPQIISVSALTGCFSRVGILAYRDYCDANLLEWSGWHSQSSGVDVGVDEPDLISLAKALEATGGGDYPEAVKTALAKAYQEMRPEAKTLILLYTDAPPHTRANRTSITDVTPNGLREEHALSDQNSYGGSGSRFVDWVSACRELREGKKQAQVFCLLEGNMPWQFIGYYNYLSTMTGGSSIRLMSTDSLSISKVTMDLLLAWMGIELTGCDGPSNSLAELTRFIDVRGIKRLKHENDPLAGSFFSTTSSNTKGPQGLIRENIANTALTVDRLQKHLPKKNIPIADFARSWSTNPEYQALAVKHLMKIIDLDVTAIALNPVFGNLWRTICADRAHEARDELARAFSLQVNNLAPGEKKAALKAWLEASYDHSAEIISIIDNVPDHQRFPCVFLDPTLSFKPDINDDTDRPVTSFTRAELLEIGRSCDPMILRRLGSVLTRLTYVDTAANMPQHISTMSNAEVPKIPMALATDEYGRQFWKLLLHLVVPGTKLSTRPATVLAALSLRLGIAPLAEVACQEMLNFKDKWNDKDVPENWTVSCLSLLLDADQAYSQRLGSTDDPSWKLGGMGESRNAIKPSDRALFEHLIAYRMLELNLDSTLMARVGWTPEKATAPIGPLVVCRSCRYPRSVTIMGPNHRCGCCLSTEPKELEKRVGIGVSQEDTELSQGTWVECCVRECRAQYIVYCTGHLNVRAKCHYCRLKGKLNSAPWVECTQCLSRVIWPESYRPQSFVKSRFVCPPCDAKKATIVDVETTARNISAENSISWLAYDIKNPSASPFQNRSIYATIWAIGTDAFRSRIKLFPPVENSLTLKSKVIRNSPELIATLQGFISRLQTEKMPFSLCFSEFRPDALNPACGRRGCFQRLCTGCLPRWYGINRTGRIINTGALSCPFCRRLPSARTLAKYGAGIHALRNLADAVRDKGTWIYAWCVNCSSAAPFVERVCAQGAPRQVNNWVCEDCREQQRLEALRIALEAQAIKEEAKRRRLEEQAMLDRIKRCPGCGSMTEKSSGCGHMVCIVPRCRVHWCYYCAQKVNPSLIYVHMQVMHGGYYGEDDE